jgi:hypothetical protein
MVDGSSSSSARTSRLLSRWVILHRRGSGPRPCRCSPGAGSVWIIFATRRCFMTGASAHSARAPTCLPGGAPATVVRDTSSPYRPTADGPARIPCGIPSYQVLAPALYIVQPCDTASGRGDSLRLPAALSSLASLPRPGSLPRRMGGEPGGPSARSSLLTRHYCCLLEAEPSRRSHVEGKNRWSDYPR